MIDFEKLKIELQKIREFLHGAHLATENENCSALLHLACHKIDDIFVELK